ncbi:hypothetical protein BDB01DRAFT_776256, partial [Pilobolus umbonatus]
MKNISKVAVSRRCNIHWNLFLFFHGRDEIFLSVFSTYIITYHREQCIYHVIYIEHLNYKH